MIQRLRDDASTDVPLVPLFDATAQFVSESPEDAVVPPEGREGVYLGSGDGTDRRAPARKTPLVILFRQLFVPEDSSR